MYLIYSCYQRTKNLRDDDYIWLELSRRLNILYLMFKMIAFYIITLFARLYVVVEILLTCGLGIMVLNVTFNNISVISWRSVLLVEETGVLGEKHRPAASHWQTLSHKFVSSTPRHDWDSHSQITCGKHLDDRIISLT